MAYSKWEMGLLAGALPGSDLSENLSATVDEPFWHR